MYSNNNDIRPRFTGEHVDKIIDAFHEHFANHDINDAALYLKNHGLDSKLRDYENGDILFQIASRFYKMGEHE